MRATWTDLGAAPGSLVLCHPVPVQQERHPRTWWWKPLWDTTVPSRTLRDEAMASLGLFLLGLGCMDRTIVIAMGGDLESLDLFLLLPLRQARRLPR